MSEKQSLASVATTSLISQYDAALRNLRGALEVVPDERWNDPGDTNRFWHIAYHVLFFADLYMTLREEEYRPWSKGRREAVPLGANPWDPDLEFDKSDAYAKEELLGYLEAIRARLEETIAPQDLTAPSGFNWLPMSRLEAHIYNIRHLQHHTAQLVERLREKEGIHVGWVGKREE